MELSEKSRERSGAVSGRLGVEKTSGAEHGVGGHGAGAEITEMDFNMEWQNSPLRSNALDTKAL